MSTPTPISFSTLLTFSRHRRRSVGGAGHARGWVVLVRALAGSLVKKTLLAVFQEIDREVQAVYVARRPLVIGTLHGEAIVLATTFLVRCYRVSDRRTKTSGSIQSSSASLAKTKLAALPALRSMICN